MKKQILSLMGIFLFATLISFAYSETISTASYETVSTSPSETSEIISSPAYLPCIKENIGKTYCKDKNTLMTCSSFESCMTGTDGKCVDTYQWTDSTCASGCKEGVCKDEKKKTCVKDSDCPSLGLACSKDFCPKSKCDDGTCKIIHKKKCQPTKCDDGTMTECKEINGVCSCSSCSTIIIKPVCGNGVCEAGEGEICKKSLIAQICEKGKKCNIPPPTCEIICPQDCKESEEISVDLNEKFNLLVYQSAKIKDNNNNVIKITFKNLLVSNCREEKASSSVEKIIKEKVKLVKESAINNKKESESSKSEASSGGGKGGGEGSTTTSSESVSVSSGGGVGGEGPETSSGTGGEEGVSESTESRIIKCVGSKPKALLNIDMIAESEVSKNIILNLEINEKRQVGDYAISFLEYDYASKTGTFLVNKEISNCPIGCRCEKEIMECETESCKEGEILCPDGKCKKECEIIEIEECRYGCLYEGKCFPMGVRTGNNFCSENLVMNIQKESDSECNNNFECKSNICIDGKCLSQGVWKKFLKWMGGFFRGD